MLSGSTEGNQTKRKQKRKHTYVKDIAEAKGTRIQGHKQIKDSQTPSTHHRAGSTAQPSSPPGIPTTVSLLLPTSIPNRRRCPGYPLHLRYRNLLYRLHLWYRWPIPHCPQPLGRRNIHPPLRILYRLWLLLILHLLRLRLNLLIPHHRAHSLLLGRWLLQDGLLRVRIPNYVVVMVVLWLGGGLRLGDCMLVIDGLLGYLWLDGGGNMVLVVDLRLGLELLVMSGCVDGPNYTRGGWLDALHVMWSSLRSLCRSLRCVHGLLVMLTRV